MDSIMPLAWVAQTGLGVLITGWALWLIFEDCS